MVIKKVLNKTKTYRQRQAIHPRQQFLKKQKNLSPSNTSSPTVHKKAKKLIDQQYIFANSS
jgi:hypothetical protein